MTEADIEVFKRKWICVSTILRSCLVLMRVFGIDYFAYCESGFAERVLGDHIVTMVSLQVDRSVGVDETQVREGSPEYGCTTFE